MHTNGPAKAIENDWIGLVIGSFMFYLFFGMIGEPLVVVKADDHPIVACLCDARLRNIIIHVGNNISEAYPRRIGQDH